MWCWGITRRGRRPWTFSIRTCTAGSRRWCRRARGCTRPISHEVLLHLRPDVCGHVNGGTTSLDEAGIDRIIAESPMALQIVQAGNLRSSLFIVKRAREANALARLCVASDTPTGTGVM